MPSVLFWPLTSQKTGFQTGRWTLSQEFLWCPSHLPAQTDTFLLLPGAAGWNPGSLDPCCSFSSHFLSPSSLCDSICPPRFNIHLTGQLWDPCLGRNMHHSWISSSAFPNSVLTHLCWQKNREFYSFLSSDAKIWGICIDIPQARLGVRCGGDQIQEFLLLFLKYMKFPTQLWTKGFCPTVPSHHQPPNHLFHHKLSLWSTKLTEGWCKCTFCLCKWFQFFLCHSPGCPMALQEQPRKSFLVAVWKDVQGKVILK